MAYDVDVNTGKAGGGGGGGGGGARRRDARPSSASRMIASSTSGEARGVCLISIDLVALFALFGPERQKFHRPSFRSNRASERRFDDG